MSDLTLNMNDLKAKIEKLVTLHKQFKAENESLKNEIAELKKTIENQTINIENLETKNKELSKELDEEKKSLVLNTNEKINELVQEIDDCIALLNK